MNKLNKKILALVIVVTSLLLMASLANAQVPETITVWTDKPEYAPGETGTLYVVFYNDWTYAVTIEKMTVIFNEWRAYRNGQWEGNQTIVVNQAVASKQTYSTTVTFTVPTDGRAVSTTHVSVSFKTTEVGTQTLDPPYDLAVLQSSKYMEQIITIFTIQVVLVIVCTFILAATIFLSARKPQVTWKAEEKSG